MYSHEMAQQPKIRAFRDWLIATLERSEAISRTM
jgi:LysR family glycine cleavage system transcriptional activator